MRFFCLGPVLLLAGLIFSTSLAGAKTWTIYQDGSGDAPSIQAGIDAATSGDTVRVMPGTYTENVNFLGKDIVLKSATGPEATTIDGSGNAGPVVTFENGETGASVIEGFTITGGTSAPATGGGIRCRYASPEIRSNIIRDNCGNSGGGITLIGIPAGETVIEDNVIEDNYSENLGGGIEILNGRSIIIRRNKIVHNRAPDDGGGISARLGSGRVVIEDNLLLENIAGDKGGALYLYTTNPSEFVVERNLIVRNEAKLSIHNDRGAGGGLYAENARGSLRRNTFVGNISRDSRACGGGGIGLNVDIGTFIVEYNIITNSQGCGIACIYSGGERVGPNLLWENQGGDLGSGDRACPEEWQSLMLITDPFFCDPEADNYSVAENSPALEAEVMGAFAEPGCAPVAILPITWGRLKALHGSGQ